MSGGAVAGCAGADWVLEVSHMGYLFGLFDALGVPDAARAKLLEKLREKNAHELRAAAGAAGLADAADTLCSVLDLSGAYAETMEKAAALCKTMPCAQRWPSWKRWLCRWKRRAA